VPERTPPKPETARRFRRAAAFLLHWRGKDAISTEGVVEILNEAGVGYDGEDWETAAGFICAVAELAWNMARAPGLAAAEGYVRGVVADAALDEAMGA
jgi:hypothetical protein